MNKTTYDDCQLYYIQDTRTTVGNSALWWRHNSRGYTCDINAAGLYTKDQLPELRSTDKPWPVESIRKLVQHHVDVQDLYNPLADKPHTMKVKP